ncbi:hypothetical protein AN958_00740 [Leucoagaricus sp. SymC.cos]|nr:hypothetical protein AN958_00740 [Leucoagaricus sp. SymC.cos]
MAEYTTFPAAYEEYMSARERCARWVQTHSSDPDGFYSPSVPPTMLEGFIPSPPSDAGSSLSLPPKMVLRYNDGRQDVPIPHSNPSSRRHSRASRHPHPEPLGAVAGSPEEIRVLPSAVSSHPQNSHHSRSKSLPRTAAEHHRHPEEAIPATSIHSKPIPYPPPGTSHRSHGVPQRGFHQAAPGPWHGAYPSSGPTKHSRGHSSHKVPPIVYAPSGSHHSRAPHYMPPTTLYHQPRVGPNGVAYSHSAPVAIQGGPYPTPLTRDGYENRARRERTQSLEGGVVHKIPRSDGGEESDPESVRSGNTYYVLPSSGQKVHVIAPSPGQSIHTATSTTKSHGPSPRKPFFQRLFNFAKIGSSTGASTQPGPRRKLQRRHSTGESGRPTDIPVNATLETGVPN